MRYSYSTLIVGYHLKIESLAMHILSYIWKTTIFHRASKYFVTNMNVEKQVEGI